MSERLEFKGDYMGFTYNGRHSSEFGLVRVSDGSRFNENLLPTMQDKTVQVPGGDGTYYFGSYYTQRQFSVSFAFDALTENKLTELKRHFGDKGIHDLIFDETPYKVWSAKVTGTATIKYIPFDEGSTHRLYKGEGSIQFTCYHPFARCAFSDTVTKESLRKTYPNVDEWWDAARIEPGKNFGDVPVPFALVLSGEDSIMIDGYTIEWKLPTECKIEETTYPARGVLNTRTGIVIQEYDKENTISEDDNGEKTITSNTPSWEKTNNILNEYVTGNLTVKVPVGEGAPTGAIYTCLYI